MWCAEYWRCDSDDKCWDQHKLEDGIICGELAETMSLSAFETYFKKYNPSEMVNSVYPFDQFLIFMRSAENYADRFDGIFWEKERESHD